MSALSVKSLWYLPKFLSAPQADRVFSWLLETTDWQRESFRIFGRAMVVPRQLAWYGDAAISYRYSGIEHPGRGWPSDLASLRDLVCRHTGLSFNFVLLNRYDNGSEYMGWHRDDEAGVHPLIASLSLGAERRFRIRTQDEEGAEAMTLQHGSLLTFDGRLQHTLPRTARPAGCRINLTFRYVAPRP